jgi:septation ring formation regulator EzrA
MSINDYRFHEAAKYVRPDVEQLEKFLDIYEELITYASARIKELSAQNKELESEIQPLKRLYFEIRRQAFNQTIECATCETKFLDQGAVRVALIECDGIFQE